MKTVVLASLASVASATLFFEETFSDSWEDKWVKSTFNGDAQGKWEISAGKFFADAEKDKGLRTSQDSKYYGISAKFDTVSNKDKTLVVQFSAKNEQNIDCGGGYIKVFSSSIDQAKLHGETPYCIMFGPDICGSTKRVHVIFNYKGKNLLKKVDIPAKSDEFTHLYTLIVNPDNTYEVLVDMESVAKGLLEDDWEFLEPKMIEDPAASKPDDWDDEAKIPDPEDKKPESWDDSGEFMDDPNAVKPDDWDDVEDGTWEPPLIANANYQGPWEPKMIENSNYQGKWIHPMINNPDYKEDPNLYLYEDISAVGFDLWQVKSGSIFDNVIISDDPSQAMKFAKETFEITAAAEKKAAEAAKLLEQEMMEKEAEKAKKEHAEKANKDDADEDSDVAGSDEEIKDQEAPEEIIVDMDKESEEPKNADEDDQPKAAVEDEESKDVEQKQSEKEKESEKADTDEEPKKSESLKVKVVKESDSTESDKDGTKEQEKIVKDEL